MTRLITVWGFACLSLSGCVGLGTSEYGCKGLPRGVQCQSAREVYAGTNIPAGMQVPGYESQAALDVRDRWPQAPWVNAPTLDAPEPIRAAPRVMRIYIFPYEDRDGDLNMPGYVYTEIEPRRWSITDFATNRKGDGAGPVFSYGTRRETGSVPVAGQ